MRSITICLVLFLHTANFTFAQSEDCSKYAFFGETKICLPEIVGMKECYEVPNVKQKADQFEFEGNTILGFYITNRLYNQIDRFDELFLEEYFKIYAVNRLKNTEVGLSELNEFADKINNNYIKENWDNLKREVEKNKNYISIGKPVLIESYSPNDVSRTFLMLGKIESAGSSYVMLMSMNIIIIKDRLIWLAYYKNYNGDESINYIKSNNDYAVMLLIDENF